MLSGKVLESAFVASNDDVGIARRIVRIDRIETDDRRFIVTDMGLTGRNRNLGLVTVHDTVDRRRVAVAGEVRIRIADPDLGDVTCILADDDLPSEFSIPRADGRTGVGAEEVGERVVDVGNRHGADIAGTSLDLTRRLEADGEIAVTGKYTEVRKDLDGDVLLGSLDDLCDLVAGEVCVMIPSE